MPQRVHRETALAVAATLGTVVPGLHPAVATEPPTPASLTGVYGVRNGPSS
ncbi:hypothetical protein [Streptomyces sp. NPDC012825]|uniref:hypothetical protein n=1 Tax=Streptomyces sp. NPDC012825 TaxID=3364851 RepID=UPI00367BD8F1